MVIGVSCAGAVVFGPHTGYGLKAARSKMTLTVEGLDQRSLMERQRDNGQCGSR